MKVMRGKRFGAMVLAVCLVCLVCSCVKSMAYADETQPTRTTQKVQVSGSDAYCTVSNIDVVRRNDSEYRIYEGSAPVVVSFNNIDLQSVEIRHYIGAKTNYKVDSDGSVEIGFGRLFHCAVHSVSQITDTGLYEIDIQPAGAEKTTIYMYVTNKPVTAVPTSSTVKVNGKAVSFDAYNINGNNYFKLRDIAYVLNGTPKQFGVDWNDLYKYIYITSNTSYETVGNELTVGGKIDKQATPTVGEVYVDNQYVLLTSYNIDGYNYFKLRDLASALNFGVTYAGDTNTVDIDTSTGYTA